MAEMKVYAKWKAVQISTAIENGEVPQPGISIYIYISIYFREPLLLIIMLIINYQYMISNLFTFENLYNYHDKNRM
jgi:hypothetical protein